MLKPLSHFVFLLCLCPLAVVAQINIKGKILDSDTKKEVPFASVFLNNTSIGARTTEGGVFELKEVKNGKYTLIVSCIGYAAAKEEIFVKGEDINLGTIKIKQVATNLSEVKIKPRKQLSASKRETYLRWFLQHFLGKTQNAKSCKLINPQILEFDYDENNGKLTATAPDFLIIENRALGYRIKFLLQDFLFDDRNYLIHYTGFSTFENLPVKRSN